MADSYSDYIIFVDESGDHGLENIDESYPVFVLVFCIFHKEEYSYKTVPELLSFKYRHFGHDQVILHETDIRKDRKDFTSLKSPEKKAMFMGELSKWIEGAQFDLVACVIDKNALASRYQIPANPYKLALGFGLERVYNCLIEKGQRGKVTHVIVEKRGKNEDDDLELEFRRVCDGTNFHGRELPFEPQFTDKKSNSSGLQLADLVARPIGLSVIRPGQPNRAFDIIKTKFRCDGNKDYIGRGLKIFP